MDEWLGIFQFAVFMLVVLLVPAMGFHVHQLLARARLENPSRDELDEFEERLERVERIVEQLATRTATRELHEHDQQRLLEMKDERE